MADKGFIFCPLLLCLTMELSLPATFFAQVDFFPMPSKPGASGEMSHRDLGVRVKGKATVLFFISPGCRACPAEAAKLEKELKRLGVGYEMEGVFRGTPGQVGEYLSSLGGYPFNFDLGLDTDGSLARSYGLKSFPSAVLEWSGKRVLVNRADEIQEKIK